MPFNPTWSHEMKVRYFRLQNIIAERALRRGRKWTARENLANLANFLNSEAEEEAKLQEKADV